MKEEEEEEEEESKGEKDRDEGEGEVEEEEKRECHMMPLGDWLSINRGKSYLFWCIWARFLGLRGAQKYGALYPGTGKED